MAIAGLAACSQMPSAGPGEKDIAQAATQATGATIQIVEVDDRVARTLAAQRRPPLFSETLGSGRGAGAEISPGDTVEVSLWEAPPATLFGGGPVDPRMPSTSRPVVLPEQMVDREGTIAVPFVGRLRVAGAVPQAVEAEVARRLRGKANQPEVLVRVLRNPSSAVTVVGEVANSVRMPLTPGGERVLDALAAAGGVRQPVSRMTLQVTRGERYHALPLDWVIRDPRQNVPLQPGDVITAIHQPLSFTALGATGKNEEITFEAQGITLAQALARAGGLNDSRSSPKGVFVFRFEQEGALTWPRQPYTTTPEGLVPVVYRMDLGNPVNFFVMQNFPVSHRDVVYVSNAPAAELQKFLNLVFSVVYPVLSTIQVTR
jgi:polysaccharide export outer membrane protein